MIYSTIDTQILSSQTNNKFKHDFTNLETNPEKLNNNMFFYEISVSCNERLISKNKLIETFKKVNFNMFSNTNIYYLVHLLIFPHNKNSIKHYLRFTISLNKKLTLKELLFEFKEQIVVINPNIQNIQVIKTKLIKTEDGISASDYFKELDAYLIENLKKNSADDYLIKILN